MAVFALLIRQHMLSKQKADIKNRNLATCTVFCLQSAAIFLTTFNSYRLLLLIFVARCHSFVVRILKPFM